eukprot:scaffold9677_cov121-Skeletonema_dohrnii-CCMP3373.AAC.4
MSATLRKVDEVMLLKGGDGEELPLILALAGHWVFPLHLRIVKEVRIALWFELKQLMRLLRPRIKCRLGQCR